MTNTPSGRRIRGPAELLQAIPYLLGFHPADSLVLVGVRDGLLAVTARVDLVDVGPGLLATTLEAMTRGGSATMVAILYCDELPAGNAAAQVGAAGMMTVLDAAADEAGCPIEDVLLVAGDHWRSLWCDEDDCCPPHGRQVPAAISAFAVDATLRGVVALADRAELERTLDPTPHRDGLRDAVEVARADVAAAPAGQLATQRRTAVRTLTAAARSCHTPRWPGLDEPDLVRLGSALGDIEVRDALWTAIDERRIDGRPLWRDLGRGLPAPFDAPALFLFGWASWRAGDGALAGIAGQRAVTSDPGYTAADLLLATLSHGLDPRTTPRLRPERASRRLRHSA